MKHGRSSATELSGWHGRPPEIPEVHGEPRGEPRGEHSDRGFAKSMALDLHGVQVCQGRLWGLAGAIKRLGNSNEWRAALNLLQLCIDKSQAAVGPDVPAFNAAVTVLGSSLLWRKSLAMVDTMCVFALQPNAITFGGLLHALGQGGNWSKAIQCFERLPRLALETNVILINTALADSRSRKRWRFGLNLLSAAVSDRVLLDMVSFNSALVVSGQAGWQRGLSMLEQVQKSGLRSDILTCNSSIQCSVDGSSWSHALYLCGTWERPNVSGFNAAVSGLAKAQEWQQARVGP